MVKVNPFLADAPNDMSSLQEAAELSDLTIVDFLSLDGLAEVLRSPSYPHSDTSFGEQALRIAAAEQGSITLALSVEKHLDEGRILESGLQEVIETIPRRLDRVNDQVEKTTGFLPVLFEGVGVERMSNAKAIELLLKRRKMFMETADVRRGELALAKEQFAGRLHRAIDTAGFPLTHEQLDARLEDTKMFFADKFALGNATVGQALTLQDENPIVHISIDLTSEHFKQVVFHELLHVVCGRAARRQGLRAGNEHGLWADEAMTEILATLLLDQKATDRYRFDSIRRPLWKPRGLPGEDIYKLHERNKDVASLSYVEYKNAFIRWMTGVPSKILIDWYIKRDGDQYETDQRAGTHAEREFQRTLKRLGGSRRVALFMQTGRLFNQADEETSTEQISTEARLELSRRVWDIARKVSHKDYPRSGPHAPIRTSARAYHHARTSTHTRRYQQRIDRAKKFVQETAAPAM